ncbi:hypothetical protein HZI73_23930 [Vallitalea pronyensis]|uniref:Uncharacterized protein n=1 Tax=Vallitalea pronyensis TaxID=1348613 RepID=A0A8J8MP54_9FIRM|nr:hypothetical protein [Vallitalea pronyensis]QUI25156.1 hypothetical protein HZI73_23930 [Vallitalea pronyensis]
MKNRNNSYWKDVVMATVIAGIGYWILSSATQTGLVDISIEALLFFTGSMIAFWGFSKSGRTVNPYFKKFQLFYGITYLTAVISFCIAIYYYIGNPEVIEVGLEEATSNNLLMVMSSIKSLTFVFLIIAWVYFTKHLDIDATKKKKIAMFFVGFFLYLGGSIIIYFMTDDMNVISLGVIVGIVIGIFAIIALDKRTRYLTMVFVIYSSIHLIEFYMMGKGEALTTGFNNVVYWWVTVLYVLEIRRWIVKALSKTSV